MANKLTPPPPTGISLLDRWLALLWRLLTADGQINWNQLGGGKTDYVPLNTAATEPTRATGQIYWDSTNKTAAIQMEGADVTLQIGQENHVFARNASGATILNGKVVYVSGAQGNRPRISLAKADSASTAVGTIGLATEDIEDTTDGYVTTQGIVNGLDTSAFVEGDVVYLSATTAGALTTTKPSGNNYIVRVGTVTRVNPSVGAILVNIQLITSEASDVILDHIGVSTYSTVQDLQNIFHSAGWVTGGVVSDNGNGTVAVTAGNGVIRATNSSLAAIKFFDFAANASVSLTNLATNWVYIDYNAGAPAITVSTTEPTEHQTKIKLAAIYRNGTELHINQTVRYEIGDHAANMVRQMQETMPYAHVSGAMMAESGTRNLNLTAGVFWNGLSRFTTAALNTAVSGTFSTFHGNGAGGWTETTGQTQINNTNYDDGDGTLGTLSANRYTNRWVYLATDSDVHVLYGQNQHVLLSDAQTESVPASIPAELLNDSFLIGRIIVRQGVTTLVQIDSAFDMAFNVASVNDHNDLSGLQGGTASEYYHLTSAEYTGTGTGVFVRKTGSAIDPTSIGAVTPGSGAFTTISTTGAATLGNDNADIHRINGQLGIGTTADRPFLLDTGGNPLAGGSPSFMIIGNNNKERLEIRAGGAGVPAYQSKRSNGTIGSPTATANTSILFLLGGGGHDGTDWVSASSGSISLVAQQAFTSTAQGTRFAVELCADGSATRALRFGISGDGNTTPGADNTQNFGSGSLRWKEIFAGNATINTSDAREKTPVRSLSSAELIVAKQLSSEVGIYQWLAATLEKGDRARFHVGMTVQRAIEIFTANGLDPFRYGLICYDEWGDKFVEHKAGEELPDGTILDSDWTEQTMIAGNRYGFRGTELMLLIAAGINARLTDLENRI